jgi:hypothetical protein
VPQRVPAIRRVRGQYTSTPMHPELAREKQTQPGFRHWQSLSDGFLVSLVVVGPTFLFEELWRGRPMIDQGGALWLIPALIMGIGFFAGGRVAGRNRRTHGGAFSLGVVVALMTLALIFLADMIRRAVLTQGLTWEVVEIWAACSFGALVVGGLGGINGRRGARLSKRRRQMERFH